MCGINKWWGCKQRCAGNVGSLLDLRAAKSAYNQDSCN